MLNTQQFARRSHLWPSSVFRRSPLFGSHRMILLSPPPLARSLPSKRQATDMTEPLPFSQMSGNTYVTAVYASPPLNLRLSPGDRGGDATLRKGGSPMSGESPLALAVCDAPQPYCSVIRPTDELPRISWVELDADDTIAAIFSNVRFLVNFSTPLPR